MHAGVVDQHVDPLVEQVDLLSCPSDVAQGRQVGDERVDGRARRHPCDLPAQLVHLCLATSDDSEAGARSGEVERREPAQAVRGPGDDNDRSAVHGFSVHETAGAGAHHEE